MLTDENLPSIPNPLALYPSYTYGVSLHLIKPSDYNSMMGEETRQYTPNNVLIASGGRHSTQFVRNARFVEDFYIDDLEIDTVVGVPRGSRSDTNLKFRIMEPYGATFFDRLLLVVDDDPTIRGRAWTDLPFMLQVDFFGYNDDGSFANLREMTKYIPIKLATCDMSVTNQGTEYNVTALIFSEQAFSQSLGLTPTHTEIIASTVFNYLIEYEKRLNAWQQSLLATGKIEIPTVYTIEVEGGASGEIGSSSISSKDPKNSSMADVKRSNVSADGNREGDARTLTRSSSVFSISAGTSVSAAIENVIKVSKWFTDQTSVSATSEQPLHWIKIFPEVTLLAYDNKLKTFGKSIKYKILKYRIHDNKHGVGPTPKVPRTALKLYEYLYSGKNTEIIDWSLKFNCLWMTLASANAKAFTDIDGQYISGDSTTVRPSDQDTLPGAARPANTKLQSLVRAPVVQQASETATGDTKRDPATVAATDLLKSFLRAGQDQVIVDLRIHGDPDFFKQEGLYYPAGSAIRGGRGLASDNDELYVKLSFKTFVDIDVNTGMHTTDTASFRNGGAAGTGRKPALDTSFSGFYTVATCKSTFRNGRFEQVLKLSRTFAQTVSTTPRTP